MTSPELLNSMTMPELVLQIIKLHERIVELQAENRELRAENEELKRKGNRSAAPFSKGERKKEAKRAGRKKGKGVFRHRTAPATEEITKEVEVEVEATVCGACGGELEADGEETVYRTELPPRPKPEVTAYRVEMCRCLGCGKRVRGRHPEVAADQFGATGHRLGERVMAAAHTLHYGLGVPMRKVPTILKELTGIEVTQSALTQDAERRAGGEIGAAYAGMRREVAESPTVNTDDTGWRIGGEPAYLMVFDTPETTVYQIRDRHRNEEVREVIPGDYQGVMGTDRGRSYDAAALAGVKQQKCVAHIQRSIAEVVETKTGRGRTFGPTLSDLVSKAGHLWRDHRTTPIVNFSEQAEAIIAEMTVRLRDRRLPDPDNQRLLNELGRHHDAGNLLRFLTDPRIEPANNRAERALRPAVIARKVSQCSKNQTGARTFEAFKSVTQTLAKNGESVIDGLYALFRSSIHREAPA